MVERADRTAIAALGALLSATVACNELQGIREPIPAEAREPTGCSALPVIMPVISRGVPAYASSFDDDNYVASKGNDADYETAWQSGDEPTAASPAWLAYDLSSVDPNARRTLVAVYTNWTEPYDHAAPGVDEHPYDNVADYTIQGSRAAGNPVPNEESWVELARVDGNTLHSRQHVLDFDGYRWIRVRITKSDVDKGDLDHRFPAINFDVHDASRGVCDDWIFFGDQLTVQGLAGSRSADGAQKTLAQLVEGFDESDRFPLVECGGNQGETTADAQNSLLRKGGWLSVFPGRYVGLNYGWEDGAFGDLGAEDLRFLLGNMATAIEKAGKVPVIPKVPWAPPPALSTVQAMNREIDELVAEDAAILPGPDLYAVFEGRDDLFSDATLTRGGVEAYRKAFADWMKATVYRRP